MNIIEKTQPDFISIEETEEEVLFHYENGRENEFINFLKEKKITFSTFCRPTKITNIQIDIDDYLSILNCIIDVEESKYTATILLNNAVVHINNVGSNKCDKIEIDPNDINVYRNNEEIFSINYDINKITELTIATDIGNTRYGPNFIPFKWFENHFKRIEDTIDFESDY